jgi:hypothetical protein
VAGQLLKEKFDISKHMIHLYQMAKQQRRILEKLNMPIEAMSSVRQQFADNFLNEVEEKWSSLHHHERLDGERGHLRGGRGGPHHNSHEGTEGGMEL